MDKICTQDLSQDCFPKAKRAVFRGNRGPLIALVYCNQGMEDSLGQCIVVQCSAVNDSTGKVSALQWSAGQYCARQCRAGQGSAVQGSIVPDSTGQGSTVSL